MADNFIHFKYCICNNNTFSEFSIGFNQIIQLKTCLLDQLKNFALHTQQLPIICNQIEIYFLKAKISLNFSFILKAKMHYNKFVLDMMMY